MGTQSSNEAPNDSDLASSSALPSGEWRLVAYDEHGGAVNMAIDEAIAEATVGGRAPPTLRFYGWQPACLSLGRNQPLGDVDRTRCEASGVDIVRRPTGGRAILHIDELTYSISGPTDEPRLRGGILEVYHRISAGLILGLARLGVGAQETEPPSQRLQTESAACFDLPAAHEITVGGLKLIGSAQARRVGWVLQHGSLPLRGDVSRIVDLLNFERESEREALKVKLRDRACTLSQTMAAAVQLGPVCEALAAALSDALNVRLVPAELTHWEIKRAQSLLAVKYASADWIGHR